MLVLGKTPKRILEVKKENGKILKLNVRERTFEQVKENTKYILDLKNQVEDGKITDIDYIDKTIGFLIENYKYSDFKDIKIDHITEIIRALNKLQLEKPKEEKKNQSKKNMRK